MTHSLTEADLAHLRQSIQVAEDAVAHGTHPFGSIVVSAAGEVVSSCGNNSLPPEGDPTQHAELQAVAAAFRVLGADGMKGSTLFTSAEPCAMCSGAIYWSGIGRMVFACSEARLGEIAGIGLNVPSRAVLQTGARIVTVVGPNLEDEAAEVHQEFWPKHLGKA